MVLDVKECIKVDKSPVSDGIYPRLHLREEIGGTRWRSLHPYEPKLTDAEAIKNCITECHTRIEMGLHYRIPYPRPVSSNLYIIHACFNFQHLNSSTLSRILKIKGFSKILGKILAKFAWHCTLKQPRCPQALKLHVNTDAPNMETSSGV
ncbi:LYR motif containing protein 1 isoform X4 [Rhinoraja longicauda]